jgi:hypothetical protein
MKAVDEIYSCMQKMDYREISILNEIDINYSSYPFSKLYSAVFVPNYSFVFQSELIDELSERFNGIIDLSDYCGNAELYLLIKVGLFFSENKHLM